MARVDALEQRRPGQGTEAWTRWQKDRQRVRGELKDAMRRFETAAPRGGNERVSALGILASAYKRVASSLKQTEEDVSLPGEGDYRQSLEEARHNYFACYQAGARDSWPLVQYLSLTVALDPEWQKEQALQDFKRRWTMAEVMSRDALRSDDLQRQAWAHSSLAELWVLAAAWEGSQVCVDNATHHVRELHEITQLRPYADVRFDMYSLYRQIRRLLGWGTPEMIVVSRALDDELRKRGARALWART
jgi:hypothetical protein